MTTWIWIAIIVLVIYLMFRRQNQGQGTCCGGAGHTQEPREAPRDEKVIAPEEIAQAEAEHVDVTAEHREAAEEVDETKAA